MKIIRYSADSGTAHAGIVEDGVVFDAGESVLHATRGREVGPLDGIRLLAPVGKPDKIICMGPNYLDHAEEAGQPLPEVPLLFSKFANCVIGPGDPIVIPKVSNEVDYEAELGVVIGKRGRNIPVDEALDYVLGYTCVDDVSARDLQFENSQWFRGKSLDSFCPIGPWIVTADEIPDPQILGIRCVVNGDALQDSNTKLMARGVAEIIAFTSLTMTLEPGDVISTGTPSGVGFTRKPPIFLKPGDVVRVEIDGIGTLENPVVAES